MADAGAAVSARSIDCMALIDWFRREIAKTQLERPARPGITAFGELEWVVFEREKLLELVNAKCAGLGMPAVNMDAVMQVENLACGHIDYTSKLALGAAELVLAN